MSDSDRGKDNKPRWVIPALVGMAIILLTALGYVTKATSDNWNASQQNAREIQSYTARYERERCVGLDVAEGVKCIADARKAAADQERDEADLYAQRQMAAWAFLVAVTAFVSIPLSVTGILFVWRSLAMNREAVGAAVHGNENALKAMKADLRPWMEIKEIKVKNFRTSAEHITLNVEVLFENVGKSPAKKIDVRATIHKSEDISDLPDILKLVVENRKRSPSIDDTIFPSNVGVRKTGSTIDRGSTVSSTGIFAFVSICYMFDAFPEVHQTAALKHVWTKHGMLPANQYGGLDLTPGAQRVGHVVLVDHGGIFAD